MVQHFFSFLFAPSSEFKDENPFGQNEMTHCRRPTDLYFEIQPILAKRRSDYLETRITQNESPNCGRQIRASLLDTEGSGQNLVGEGGAIIQGKTLALGTLTTLSCLAFLPLLDCLPKILSCHSGVIKRVNNQHILALLMLSEAASIHKD